MYEIFFNFEEFFVYYNDEEILFWLYYYGFCGVKIEYEIINNNYWFIIIRIYNEKGCRIVIKWDVFKKYRGVNIVYGKGFYFSVVFDLLIIRSGVNFKIIFKVVEVIDRVEVFRREVGFGCFIYVWYNWDIILNIMFLLEVIELMYMLG